MPEEPNAFTPNARKIFDQLKPYFPPDPWKNPQWTDDGVVTVLSGSRYDLRNRADRTRLIQWYEHLIGTTIVLSARIAYKRGERLSRRHINIKMIRGWAEIALLLEELDFQIETMDIVESL